MNDFKPLDLLLEQRKQHWLMHCRFVLERLLMPLCFEGVVTTTDPSQRAVVLVDNRIDEQWLFTLLNTWLMCPKDSEFVLIADGDSVTQAEDLLKFHAPGLKASVLDVAQLMPGVQIAEPTSFNAMLKRPEFWRHMPHEPLLIIQTDALLSRPLDPFFFQFPYLGAPFLPRQHSEYFEKRRGDGRISGEIADKALAMLEIDQDGLDEMDKRILEAIIVKFSGGPVGLSSLAVAVGEEPDTLEEVYEPYLILEGYLNRTPQGRVATEASFQKLGLSPISGTGQQELL